MNDSYGAGQTAEGLAGPLLRQIGTHLRLAREERGENLHEVASFLRIRRAYLHDLEEGDLHKIPGRTYALGFLRSYADHLGFNGEAIVDEVKRANAALPETPQLLIREPLQESQRPPLVLVGVSVLLAAVIYLGWTSWQEQRAPESAGIEATVIEPPADAADRTPPAAAPTIDPRTETTTASVEPEAETPELPALPSVPEPLRADDDGFTSDPAAAPAPELPTETEAAIEAIIDGSVATSVADAAAAEADATETVDLMATISAESGVETPQPFGDQEVPGRVILVASEASWVQIRSADRDFLWTRTMQPGDAYFVPDRTDLALWTGNAGGLKVIVDGEPFDALGASGQVRRDIPLEADALRAQYAPD